MKEMKLERIKKGKEKLYLKDCHFHQKKIAN